MRPMTRVGAMVLGVAAFCMVSAYAASTCTYDPDAVKPPKLPSETVEFSKWDNDKKELRAVLKDGAVLFVKYWACEHYGLSAEIAVSIDADSDPALRILVERVAAATLDQQQIVAVRNALARQKEMHVGQDIEVHRPGSSEFWISTRRVGVLTVVSLSYYFS